MAHEPFDIHFRMKIWIWCCYLFICFWWAHIEKDNRNSATEVSCHKNSSTCTSLTLVWRGIASTFHPFHSPECPSGCVHVPSDETNIAMKYLHISPFSIGNKQIHFQRVHFSLLHLHASLPEPLFSWTKRYYLRYLLKFSHNIPGWH